MPDGQLAARNPKIISRRHRIFAALATTVSLTLLGLSIPGFNRRAGAQPSPSIDVAVLEGAPAQAVHWVSRQTGGFVGFQSLPSASYENMIAGYGDDSVFVVQYEYKPSTITRVLRVERGGTITTVGAWALNGSVQDLRLDDNGDLLVLWYEPGRTGIYSSPLGASSLTLRARWLGSIPIAFTEDHATGDWFVVDVWGAIHRVARNGTGTTMLRSAGTTYLSRAGAVVDPASDDLILTQSGGLVRFDLQTRQTTTFYRPATVWALPYRLTVDDLSRGYLTSGIRGYGHGNAGMFSWVDNGGNEIYFGTVSRLSYFTGIASANGRVFTPVTGPAIGSTYRVRFTVATEVGRRYQAAFALGHRPGIPTPRGRIPIAFDTMFLWSQSGAPIFRNMAGVLDPDGRAAIEVDLQPIPATRGLRMHLAAITYDQGGIRGIYGPHSFTLR